ncbi:hypothetical protein [Oxalicibacterium faecigallinarum]|uniref:Uncharacterized protein n=1 Tax=Oxalicibacterium faecigallinarum TaxID=573741 RepID=A0A8J3AMR4_9BURK|nr:hypothetical protein [Oxalicibacterium faecigallinarum]GGI16484.1 hypothetical protein GCM10008066_04190 [Oxalicibacterium faecigallinarum]
MSASYKAAVLAINSLTKAGAVVLGLSALLIAAGWHEVTIYYAQLGASWAVQLYSPGMLMTAGLLNIAMLATTSYVALIILIRSDYSEQKLQVFAQACMGLGFVLGTATLHTQDLISHEILIGGLVLFSRCIFTMGVGMSFAALVRRIRDDGLEWNEKHLGLMVAWLYFGIVMSALPQAQYTAKRDSSLERSALANVKIKDEDGVWRLLAAGDKLILMQIQEGHASIFKVIQPETAEWISKDKSLK